LKTAEVLEWAMDSSLTAAGVLVLLGFDED
jgi:hypothetical protein